MNTLQECVELVRDMLGRRRTADEIKFHIDQWAKTGDARHMSHAQNLLNEL